LAEPTILAWLLIGVVAGALANLAVPGRVPGGSLVAVLLGIAGALLAGFLLRALGLAAMPVWIDDVAAAAGSVVLLASYRMVLSRRLR